MCLVVLVAGILGPRVGFILTWILTDRVQEAFSGGWVVPLLGVIFLPWTALVYAFAWSPTSGVSVVGMICVLAGFIADVLTYTSRMIANSSQRSRSVA